MNSDDMIICGRAAKRKIAVRDHLPDARSKARSRPIARRSAFAVTPCSSAVSAETRSMTDLSSHNQGARFSPRSASTRRSSPTTAVPSVSQIDSSVVARSAARRPGRAAERSGRAEALIGRRGVRRRVAASSSACSARLRAQRTNSAGSSRSRSARCNRRASARSG